MNDDKVAGAPPRRRRSTKEVQDLILVAATQAFASKGYAKTTVREIAKGAGVHEPMIYHHYATKADLYNATVLAPLNGAISAYLAADSREADVARRFRSLVEPLFSLFAQNRQVAVALAAREQISGEASDVEDDPTRAELVRILDILVPRTEEVIRVQSPSENAAALVTVTLGMALGVALLQPYLSGSDYELTSEQLLEEMEKFRFLSGSAAQPAHPCPSDEPGAALPSPAAKTAGVHEDLFQRLAEAKEHLTRIEEELQTLSGAEPQPKRQSPPRHKAWPGEG